MALPLDELLAAPALVNQRAQELSWDELLFEYELALDDIQVLLAGLTEAQVRFKPATDAYSITEIVTHNAYSDKLIFDWLAQLAAGRMPDLPHGLAMKDGARNDATLDGLNGLIESCRVMARAAIVDLPDPCNLALTAAHSYFGPLNAKGWLYLVSVNHAMQLRQAEQVIDTPGFPADPTKVPDDVRYDQLRPKPWIKSERQRPTAARERSPRSQGAGGKAGSSRKTRRKKS